MNSGALRVYVVGVTVNVG